MIAKKYNITNKIPTGIGRYPIAIISLGGSYSTRDAYLYWIYVLGRPLPVLKINLVNVAESKTSPTDKLRQDDDGSIENTLDIQIAMGISGSDIYFYSTPNTVYGFLAAIRASIQGPAKIISISWGLNEIEFGVKNCINYDKILQTANTMGKTICVASGDDGSTDGLSNQLCVDFPSSSPNVIACGGTTLNLRGVDTVWSGTGGGVSNVFVRKDNQKNIVYTKLQDNVKIVNPRSVPDIAMSSDPSNGWTIVYGGYIYVNGVGGTSCVSPCFSGYLARIKKSSNIINKIYTNCLLLNGAINSKYFTDIVSGTNNDYNNSGYYNACVGFDQCSGLGCPIGDDLATIL